MHKTARWESCHERGPPDFPGIVLLRYDIIGTGELAKMREGPSAYHVPGSRCAFLKAGAMYAERGREGDLRLLTGSRFTEALLSAETQKEIFFALNSSKTANSSEGAALNKLFALFHKNVASGWI